MEIVFAYLNKLDEPAIFVMAVVVVLIGWRGLRVMQNLTTPVTVLAEKAKHIETKVDHMSENLDRVTSTVERMGGEIAATRTRVDDVDRRFDRFEERNGREHERIEKQTKDAATAAAQRTCVALHKEEPE